MCLKLKGNPLSSLNIGLKFLVIKEGEEFGAKETNSLIAFGKLKGIRKQDKGRKFNRKLNSSPYYKLTQYIRYKANEEKF